MRFLLLLAAFLVLHGQTMAEVERCFVCGEELGSKAYLVADKVTNEKKPLCEKCTKLTEVCFACGLPVKTNATQLTDGRLLCARDAKNAVLNEDEAKRVSVEVKDTLDRLFSRFLTFPGTNVETEIVDRVHLVQLFKIPGNDFQCPLVLGYVHSDVKADPNRIRFNHHVHLLSALPLAQFKAVCAHEFTHTWINENLSPQRKGTLGRDANEGFCELIAWLLMESGHEEDEMKIIRSNQYTRGQIDLFIEAYNRYGLNEVAEWMKYGVDAVLDRNDVNNVRKIEMPSRPKPTFADFLSSQPTRTTPDSLVLRGITWTQNRPMALINDRTFEIKERGRVHVGDSNLLISCLEITTNSVVVQVDGAANRQVLILPER
jgi:hypothetical protein